MKEKWSIGEVAKLFEVSTDTLRYYEKIGLLSSHKDRDNGYRYYYYDEIVLLMDIFFFRNMEIPVKEIGKIVTTMNIGDIKNVLCQNQRIVEDRIQELIKLKRTITQAMNQYTLCEELVGHFLFVPAPKFKYKLGSNQTEDVVAMIRKYKKEDWLNDNIQYTLFVSREELLQKCNFYSAQIGLSVEEENLSILSMTEQSELLSFDETEYLYTVIGTNYSEQRNDMLNNALKYIKETGRAVTGPLIGRYIASEHRNGNDYYEIWIPTTST